MEGQQCPQAQGTPNNPSLPKLGAHRFGWALNTTLWATTVCSGRRGLPARPDIEVKHGAPLNYSLGERGPQDGVLLFCSVINSL